MQFSEHYAQFLLYCYTVNALATLPMVYFIWRARRNDKYFIFNAAWAGNAFSFFWTIALLRWLKLLHGPDYWVATWIFALLLHGIVTVTIRAYLGNTFNGR